MSTDSKGILLVGEPMGLFMATDEGPLEDARNFDLAACGAELNVAIGASRLGHKVAYVTKLGRDPFAKVLLDRMEEEGISSEFVSFSDTNRTGIMFKNLNPGGDPSIFYMRAGSAASTLSAADVDALDFSGYGVVHMTGITAALTDSTRTAIDRLFERGREAGAILSFDPNLRLQLWPNKDFMCEYLNDCAAKADYFEPGVAEGRLLLGKPEATPEEIADAYLAKGCGCVIVKDGARGAYYNNGTESGWGRNFKVETIVDTVGAGDGFACGVITALVEGLPIYDAVSRGNAIGSLQIQVRGDNEGLPTREKLDAYMA